MNTIYSYHTFYFPFVWNMKSIEYEEYVERFSATLWQCTNDNIEENTDAFDADIEKKYRKYHYFSRSAREIIGGMGGNFVTNLSYDPEHVHNNAKYIIKTKEKTYELLLNGIKLKIYNTGIAIFIFECKNTSHTTIDDVKCINEYGRRLYAPFLGASSVMCADKIGIKYEDRQSMVDLESKFSVDAKGIKNINYIPEFITELLPSTVQKNIFPAIDDRMFIACLVNDKEYSQKIINYPSEEEISADLYEFIFVNKPSFCGCSCLEERLNQLNSAIYKRWLGKRGEDITLWGITHNSFMGITSVDADYLVEIPFLYLYTEMLALCISQRASILRFDYIASELSSGFEKKGRNLRARKIRELIVLQEKYIAFLNQFMNCEITSQEQGIEIYDMLQEKTGIEKALSHLSEEIRVMYEEAGVIQNYNLGRYGALVAAIALIIQIIQWIMS